MIITVINQKGGVGKTTTVATLARLWTAQRPLVIDTDEQQAVSNFNLKGCRVVPCAPERVADTLAKHYRANSAARSKHSLAIIDCPPSHHRATQAIESADLIIVPVQAEYMAFSASVTLLKLIGPDAPAMLLLTMLSGTTGRSVTDAARLFDDARVFRTAISRNKHVTMAATDGLTVLDFAPESLAARQYIRLGKEIEEYYGTRN